MTEPVSEMLERPARPVRSTWVVEKVCEEVEGGLSVEQALAILECEEEDWAELVKGKDGMGRYAKRELGKAKAKCAKAMIGMLLQRAAAGLTSAMW